MFIFNAKNFPPKPGLHYHINETRFIEFDKSDSVIGKNLVFSVGSDLSNQIF